jgi:hypothetical protein
LRKNRRRATCDIGSLRGPSQHFAVANQRNARLRAAKVDAYRQSG